MVTKCEQMLIFATRIYDSKIYMKKTTPTRRQVRMTVRKQPKQERAQETVAVILDATAQVLIKAGFESLTTNRVAELAGVSIGSLYQYFPNKMALVSALIERHLDSVHAAVFAELARVATLPLAAAFRSLIELTLRARGVNPDVQRVLIEQVPRSGRMARARDLDALLHVAVAQFLAARRSEIVVSDLDLATFITVSAIEAIATRAVLFAPGRLQDPNLVEEVTTLVVGYLTGVTQRV
jgi:AcrR family transcriptional regulator